MVPRDRHRHQSNQRHDTSGDQDHMNRHLIVARVHVHHKAVHRYEEQANSGDEENPQKPLEENEETPLEFRRLLLESEIAKQREHHHGQVGGEGSEHDNCCVLRPGLERVPYVDFAI